ncbi:hypothetical protein PybrP1_007699, partial [[Pythium] brassicae (nom. inval.)]
MFMPFARLVAATCGFARSVSTGADVTATLDIDSPFDTTTASNSSSSRDNNNSEDEDEEDDPNCILLQVNSDPDTTSDCSNNDNNNQTSQEPLRVLGVGWDNMENELLVAPTQREAKSNVIFFPGDVQDFRADMVSGAFPEFCEFAYEHAAAVLADKFGGDCNVWVIRPAHFFQRAFSCFDNFVETNEIGAATAYSSSGTAIKHLLALLESVRCTLLQRGVSVATDLPLHLVGFSKGVIVLNQLITELAICKREGFKSNNRREALLDDVSTYHKFFSQVRSIHWVDGGNASSRGCVPSNERALAAIHDVSNARLVVHVTPYQYDSKDRPWIKQEIEEFIQQMRRHHVDVQLKMYNEGEVASIHSHFQLLRDFEVQQHTTYVASETPRGGGSGSPAAENRLEVAFAHAEGPAQESASKQAMSADGKIVPFSVLFSFADRTDKLLMFFGTVGGLAAGLSQPIQIVLFGDILNSFNPTNAPTAHEMHERIIDVALNFVWVGLAVIVAGFMQVACWSMTASRQAKRIRAAYVSAIITKEIGWFDVNEPMQLATRESLSNIRTVHMFNSIDHFVKKYEDALGLSTAAGIKKGIAVGWGTGLMFFTVFCTYACGMFFGALFVANDNLDGNTCTGDHCYNGGRVLTVFFSIIMGAMALGQAGPSVQAMFSARAAAFDVFSVIKRASLIDPLSDDGVKLPSVRGEIEINRAQNRSKGDGTELSTNDLKLFEDEMSPSHEQHGDSRSLSRRSFSKFSLHENEGPGKEKGVAVEDDANEDGTVPKVSLLRIWKMSAPEWKFLVLGGVGAILNASVFPVWGILLTKVTVLFFKTGVSKSDMLWDARYWSFGFIGLGVAFGLSIIMQNYGFAVASQKLVSRVRLATFSAMIRQEVGWFDLDENSSGALVSRLATDSAILQAMTSDTLNQGLVNMTTLGIGFGIAFYFSWQMTLALLATSPVLIFSSFVQAQQMGGTNSGKKTNDADSAAGSLLAEAIGSIRTIASFSMEKAINRAYVGFLDTSRQADIKVGFVGGAAFGFSQGVMFLNLAFLFWLGGKWVSSGTITFEDMFMVIMVIMLSTFAVGMAAQNMTDSNKAKRAASRVFQVMDRVPEIDATSTAGRVLPSVG